MEQQLSLHLKKFNDRIKVMNQTNAKDLILTRLEAQNLQSDIFELLTQIQALTEVKLAADNEVLTVGMDGGLF